MILILVIVTKMKDYRLLKVTAWWLLVGAIEVLSRKRYETALL